MSRLGPAAPGPLSFRLNDEPYLLSIPVDGLEVCGWVAVGNWYALVPGCLADDSADRFYDLLGDPYGPVGLRTCARLAYGLAKPVYGFEWHVAQRLAVTAREHWDLFSAYTVGVGFDPEGAPAHRVCSAVYAWLRSGCQEEKDVRKLETQLNAPPRQTLGRGRRAIMPGFDRKAQADNWKKAFAELGGG